MNHNFDPQTGAFEPTDPTLEALQAKYQVTELTAQAISALGGEVTSGGFVSEKNREPGAATGTTEQGPGVWNRLQKAYGDTVVRSVAEQVKAARDEDGVQIESHAIIGAENVSPEDLRDLMVYVALNGNTGVNPRPTEEYTATNMKQGDPSIVVGTADYLNPTDGKPYVLEVASGQDSEGGIIGSSVCLRPRDAAKYPNDGMSRQMAA